MNINKRHIIFLILIFKSLLTFSQIENEDLFQYSLKDLLNLKIDLKTGSFLDLDLKETPVSLTLITEDQIETSGARHLSELLEIYVPGFQYMYNKWNGIIWGMRGVASNRNTAFIFLVNGHKMNHESRDGAMSELDLGFLNDIERIEVLRGPAGLVYGSGSIAGVINIVTKTYLSNTGEIITSAQSWDLKTYGASGEGIIHREIGEQISLTVGVGYRQSQGAGQNQSRIWGKAAWPYPFWLPEETVPKYGVPATGSTWSTPGNGKATIDFEYKKLRFYSRLTHQVTNGSGYFPVDGWPDYPGGLDSTVESRFIDGENRTWDSFYGQIRPYNNNRRQYVLDNVSSELSYKNNYGVNQLTLKLGFDLVNNKINLENIKGYENKYPTERTNIAMEQFGEKRYNFSSLYLIKSIEKTQIAMGYELRVFDIGKDLSGVNSVDGNPKHYVVSNVVYWNNTIFLEGQHDLSKKLSLLGGTRYDLHTRTVRIGGVFSPKIGLVYKLNTKNTLKLIYQSSANNGSADNYEFNRYNYDASGQINTEYIFAQPTNRPDPNTPIIYPVKKNEFYSLKPERCYSVEMMSVHEVSNKFVVLPSISYNIIKDLFIWNQEIFRVMNGGRYNFWNADLELKYVNKKINFGLNHTLQFIDQKRTNIDNDVKYYLPVFEGYTETTVDGKPYYTPKQVKTSDGRDSMSVHYLTSVKYSVTNNGKDFLNLARNTTKLYVDYQILPWLKLNTNVRVFWGLNGRKEIYDQTTAYNNLSIDHAAIIKWNAGLHLTPSEQIKISLFVYDILASQQNPRHTIRWQQYGTPEQNDIYGADFRSLALQFDYKF